MEANISTATEEESEAKFLQEPAAVMTGESALVTEKGDIEVPTSESNIGEVKYLIKAYYDDAQDV